MRKKRIFEKIILIVDAGVLIFLAIIIYRVIILFNLEEKGLEHISKTNFKMENEVYENGYIIKNYKISNGKESTLKIININLNSYMTRTTSEYNTSSETLKLLNMGDNKYYINEKPENNYDFSLETGNLSMDLMENLRIAITGRIYSDTYEFEKCYYIKLDNGNEILVDKDTGLILQEKQIQEGTTINSKTGRREKINYETMQRYSYEFDIVGDNDIQRPDLTGYQEKIE